MVGINSWLQEVHTFPENAAFTLQIGNEMNSASLQLERLPPPNHEGGIELALGAIETTADFGDFYTRYGSGMVAIDPVDEAAAQKIVTDFSQEREDAGPVMTFYPRKLRKEVQQSILDAVPSCHDFWAWAGGEPY